jgi:hypothetical protein
MKGMKIKKYIKTIFPRFTESAESDSVPDSVSTDGSCSDASESELITKHEKYKQTKEDEDVVVFMRLAQNMSIKSLLFLLQNHARLMNIPEDVLEKQLAYAATVPSALTAAKKRTPIIKKFRFAEISGGDKVRAVVHEISKTTDLSLWWNKVELNHIRSDVIKAVRYFMRHRPGFSDSVHILAKSYLNETPKFVVEQHMKKLSSDSVARGMETHIVPMMGTLRRNSVKAVMAEQETCRISCMSYDETCEKLRSRSLVESRPGLTFAAKIAECDHIEALKASLSKWASAETPETL